jgi:hypothetical protein
VEQQGENSSSSTVDFSAIIAPLEAAAGCALNGGGRGRCLEAFKADPERFRLLCEDALDRGKNPVALLVRMVLDGDHTRPVPAKPAPVEPCRECGVGAGLHVDDCPSLASELAA